MEGAILPSSMFKPSKSGSSQLLPQYEHEIPLLDSSRQFLYLASPSQSPPIPSIYDLTSSSMAPSNTHYAAPLTILQRREKQLQEDLQSLLDAQSEGLIAGLAGGPPDDVSSNGSLTPTASVISRRATRVVPVRQPVKKKVGLRSARKGIANAMRELAEIKDKEAHIFEGNIGKTEELVAQVEELEKKRKDLETEIEFIHVSEEGRRMPELAREAGKVEAEIKELETRLYEMRAKHRVLTAEISQLENSVQSKLSSYKASLSMMDSQVNRFLAKPPLSPPQGKPDESSLFALPAKRRTLDMAREHWQTERVELTKRKWEVDVEREALENGVIIWNDVVTEVTTFEKGLRAELQRMRPADQADPNHSDHPQGLYSSMTHVLRDMDQIILQMKSKLKFAEAKDWKLLVCCIGAELEAFKEGKEILQEALNVTASQSTQEPRSRSDTGGVSLDGERQDSDEVLSHGLDELHGQPLKGSNGTVRSEDENDDPDPELLISHQDSN
ncbi:MAG: hypothetical protein M1835_008204 [Candelina submexicana]|nr:MAG: hypothetical protein M1835_008204 [Candelina submexicana]